MAPSPDHLQHHSQLGLSRGLGLSGLRLGDGELGLGDGATVLGLSVLRDGLSGLGEGLAAGLEGEDPGLGKGPWLATVQFLCTLQNLLEAF